MTGFDPGDGWRETDQRPLRGERVTWTDGHDVLRAWVREEPVPALPTVPYTVIRCIYSAGYESVRTLLADGTWQGQSEEYVRSGLTGFEVLSEPPMKANSLNFEQVRRETAKAVLDRVDSYDGNGVVPLVQLAREFGVEL